MSDLYCPYCDAEIELNHDDGAYYDENNDEQAQCPECDKYFMVNTWCTWSHEGHKADCLNDGVHEWEKVRGYSLYVINRRRCSMCGEEIELKKDHPDYVEPQEEGQK